MTSFTLTHDAPPQEQAFSRTSWPFASMQVNDCATFPEDVDYKRCNRAAHAISTQKGWKFTVRRCVDRKVRVWRIA